MAADDLQPTRLEAAKAAAQEFVEHQPSSVLIGVVAFSDSGFVVQAPTADQEAIVTTINRLTPQSGTSVANGIFASLTTLATLDAEPAPRLHTNLTPAPTPTPTPVPAGTVGPAVIVLLTDGENNESPNPLAAAQAAADRGVRVYTVGIGSAAGTTLLIDGFSVHTQLNEEVLQQISQLTIDVSGSMCSTDIPPNRLETVKGAALSFIQRQERSSQIGIVAFAGYAEMIQPPTSDQQILEATVESLITGRWTAIGGAILKSLAAIAEIDESVAPLVNDASPGIEPIPVPRGAYAPSIIVLLTDGASNRGPLPLDAAQQAVDRGVRVYTIGYGTEVGGPLGCKTKPPIPQDRRPLRE